MSGRPTAPTVGAARPDFSTLPVPSGSLTTSSTIPEVQAKLLHTNTAYRNLSGRVVTTLGDGRVASDFTLAVEQPDRFSVESNLDSAQKPKAVSNGEDVWLHNPDGTVDPRKNVGKGLAPTIPPTDPRPDRVIIPVSGTDLPLGGNANSMLHPHGVVQCVMPKGQSRIVGTENVAGREGIVLEISPDPARPTAWAGKWGPRQVFVVDTRTGILLREEQFNKDGSLRLRHEFRELAIDSPAFAADFELKLGPGERLMTPDEVRAEQGGPPQSR